MTLSLLDTLEQDSGRIEYALVIQGMPYILTSSDSLASLIDGSAEYRRKLAGGKKSTGPYADDIPVIRAIEMVGNQTIKSDATKGISVSPVSVKLANERNGQDWSEWLGPSAGTGIPGISYGLSLEFDPSINWGRLAAGINRLDTDLELFDESGGLEQYITDQITAHGQCFLWVGLECIAIEQKTTGTVGDFKAQCVTNQNRGIFRSWNKAHTIDQQSGTSDVVTATPTGYVNGRFAYLYAIACNEDVSEISEPAMIHCGIVSDNIGNTGSLTTIQIKGYDDALSTSVRSQMDPFELAGFVLTRPTDSETADDDKFTNPHLQILEYDSVGSSWQYRNIWLCGPGTRVTFATLEDLIAALDEELRYVSSGSASQQSGTGTSPYPLVQTDNNYWIGTKGLYSDHNGYGTFSSHPKVGGLLGNLCHLGAIPALIDSADADGWLVAGRTVSQVKGGISNYIHYKCTSVPGEYLLPWNSSDLYNDFHVPIIPVTQGSGFRDYCPRYIYMWSIQDGTENTRPNAQNTFPWPLESGLVYSRVYFKPNTDVSILEENAGIIFGQPGDPFRKDDSVKSGTTVNEVDPRSQDYSADDYVCEGWYGTSNGITADGLPYIDLTDDVYYKGAPQGGTDIPAIEALEDVGIAGQFGALCYHPHYHARDPFAVHQGFDVTTTDSLDLMRGLLGDPDATVTINNARKCDWVAMAYPDEDDTINEYDSIIDWDFIDDLMQSIVDGEKYRILADSETENLLKEFHAILLAHGLSMTYEFDGQSTPPMFRIRARKITDVSKAKAQSEGKYIEDRHQLLGTSGDMVFSGTYRYTDAMLSASWNGDDFELKRAVDCKDAMTSMGGRRQTLKIESKMMHLPLAAGQNTNQRFIRDIYKVIHDGILQPLALQKPSIKVQASLGRALLISAGRECFIQDSYVVNPYNGNQGFNGVCVTKDVIIDWGRRRCAVTAELAGDTAQPGRGPAILLLPGDAIRQSTTEVLITPSNTSTYSQGGRRDLSWFDCIDFLPDGSYRFRDCSCGDYAALLFEEDRTDSDPSVGTIGSIDETVSQALMTLDSTSDITWESVQGKVEETTPNRSGSILWPQQHCSDGERALVNEGAGGGYAYTSAGSSKQLYEETWNETTEQWDYSAIYSWYTSCSDVSGGNISTFAIHLPSSRELYTYKFEDAQDPTYEATRTICDGDNDKFDETNKPSSAMTAIYIIDGDNMYGARDTKGIYKMNKSTGWTSLATTGWAIATKCYAIELYGGKYYFGKGRYISRQDSEGVTYTDIDVTGSSSVVTRMCTDGTYLWIGANNGRVYTYDGSSVVQRHDFGPADITQLTYSGGSVYCSTYQSGSSSDSEVRVLTTATSTVVTSFATSFTDLTGANQGHFHMDTGGYKVWTIQDNSAGSNDLYYATADQNANPCAVVFGDRDDANLQTCQEDYIFFADDNNQIQDSSANNYPGAKVK